MAEDGDKNHASALWHSGVPAQKRGVEKKEEGERPEREAENQENLVAKARGRVCVRRWRKPFHAGVAMDVTSPLLQKPQATMAEGPCETYQCVPR